jgi:type I restriction-modification system DNA methylase subunit
MTQEEKEIIKIIKRISGSMPVYAVFTGWVQMMALSIQNGCNFFRNGIWQAREQAYWDTASKFQQTEMEQMCRMTALLVDCYENNGPYDALGSIYMNSGAGNKGTGQFFTPFHLSEAMADVALPEANDNGKVIINEPCAGGGGMILAAAKALIKRGKNPQKILEVVAQDLDWNCVYMTYVQLSLNGLDAVVIQGDALIPLDGYIPGERIFYTPVNMICGRR